MYTVKNIITAGISKKSQRITTHLTFIALLSLFFTQTAQAGLDWRISPRKAKRPNPVEATAASIAAGEKIYRKECLECHGKAGKGDGPDAADLEKKVPDITTSEIMGQSDGALYYKITVGRRPMPGFKKLLTDEERWSVVNYLRKRFGG